MPFALIVPLLLWQAGPMVSPGAAPAIPQPPLRDGRSRPRRVPGPLYLPDPSRLQSCIAATRGNLDAAASRAAAWLNEARGSAQAEPQLCLGYVQSLGEDWEAAERSFVAGRDIAALSDRGLRGRLGAMAGNAALANGGADRAVVMLDLARADLLAAGETVLAGDLAVDRARALVALNRPGEAAQALAEARGASPANADAWLLSATLSRRQGKLADAQQQIESAAALSPIDPDIGLEAGVIAMLAGHADAARRSWESVIKAGPRSPAADQASAYLAQLGPAAAPK